MICKLIEPRGEAVGVLRSYARERADHDQVEGPLQELDAGAVFTLVIAGK